MTQMVEVRFLLTEEGKAINKSPHLSLYLLEDDNKQRKVDCWEGGILSLSEYTIK